MNRLCSAAMALALVWVSMPLQVAAAVDSHAGYYYPVPVSTEADVSRAQPLPGVSRTTRVGFVTGLTAQQSELPYPAQVVIFAKGAEASKLIIIGLTDTRMNTLYRARAILTMLTAMVRTTDIF